MVRYRELRTIAQLEKEFPYVIEVAVPPKGLGRKLDKIETWLSSRVSRHEYGRWGRFRSGTDIAIWAFKDDTLAKRFSDFIAAVL